MSAQEVSSLLRKYTSNTVEISDIRIGFICKRCGHHWGVRIDDNAELGSQAVRMVCLPCLTKELANRNEGNVDHVEQQYTPK